MILQSLKAREIIENQIPIDEETVSRVKTALAKKGVVLAQSAELDEYLMNCGREASIFSDNTIIMHTKVSASGFFEELIHYGQVKSGRAVLGNEENRLMLEIEAQERLIKHCTSYRITDYEIQILRENLDAYRHQLNKLYEGRKQYVSNAN